MSENLRGAVVVDRTLAHDEMWLAEPFTRGQAWVDLMLIANDEPRVMRVRGIEVQLQRGQVGRSVFNLAERWQWARNKTRAFLDDLRDARKISYKMDRVATVITVIDFGVLNREKPANETTEGLTKGISESTTEGITKGISEGTQNIGTLELGNGNIGTGEGNHPGLNYPTVRQAMAYLQGVEAGYEEAEIRAAWSGLTASAVENNWVTAGNKPRPVADWRAALADELWKRRQIFGQKNSARAAEATRGSGEPPAPVVGDKLTLAQMMGNIL